MDARELALLKGSDLARVLFRLRASIVLEMLARLHRTAYICLVGSTHLPDALASAAQSSLVATAVQSQC